MSAAPPAARWCWTADTITFTPTPTSPAPAGFDYTISDGAGGTALGHVTVTVTPVNDAPVATGDTVTTDEDTAAVIDTADLSGQRHRHRRRPADGHRSVGGHRRHRRSSTADTITFTPTPNFTGTAGFDYTISDGAGGTALGHVTVTVTPVNDARRGPGDSCHHRRRHRRGHRYRRSAGQRHRHRRRPARRSPRVGGATGGTVELDGDTITFTPTPNYHRHRPGSTTPSPTAPAAPPSAMSPSPSPRSTTPAVVPATRVTTAEDTAAVIDTADLLANDTDIDGGPLTVTACRRRTGGTVELDGDTITFTPTPNYHRHRRVRLHHQRRRRRHHARPCHRHRHPGQRRPGGQPATPLTTAEDIAAVIDTADLLANDTDIDGGPLTVTAVSAGHRRHRRSWTVDTITFTPTPNFTGTAGFDYTVSDGAGGTALGHVTVTVTPVNDAPVANGDTVTTAEDTAAVIDTADLLANDTDIDGGPLTVTAVSAAPPAARWSWTARHHHLHPNPELHRHGRVRLHHQRRRRRHRARPCHRHRHPGQRRPRGQRRHRVTTAEDTAAVIDTADLLGNDTDIDGGPLTVTAVSAGHRRHGRAGRGHHHLHPDPELHRHGRVRLHHQRRRRRHRARPCHRHRHPGQRRPNRQPATPSPPPKTSPRSSTPPI